MTGQITMMPSMLMTFANASSQKHVTAGQSQVSIAALPRACRLYVNALFLLLEA